VPPEAYYVARTLQVLELLAFQPLSAPEVAATLQIHPRTARRILVRLHEEDYLTRSDDTRRRYSPTMRIVALGGQVVAHSPLTAHGLPVVQTLHEQTGAVAHLFVPSYLSVVCVLHADGEGAVTVHPRELVPAHCTAPGKALLAWRQRWRDSVLGRALERHTEHTLVDPAELAREADAIRTRGYAIERGEHNEDVRGVAAPVLVRGDAAAALSVSGPELDPRRVAGRVVALAAELSTALA
jgi:DNA-binding IclR family transcriptional regulator